MMTGIIIFTVCLCAYLVLSVFLVARGARAARRFDETD